jgi:PAS domain-containing protein
MGGIVTKSDISNSGVTKLALTSEMKTAREGESPRGSLLLSSDYPNFRSGFRNYFLDISEHRERYSELLWQLITKKDINYLSSLHSDNACEMTSYLDYVINMKHDRHLKSLYLKPLKSQPKFTSNQQQLFSCENESIKVFLMMIVWIFFQEDLLKKETEKIQAQLLQHLLPLSVSSNEEAREKLANEETAESSSTKPMKPITRRSATLSEYDGQCYKGMLFTYDIFMSHFTTSSLDFSSFLRKGNWLLSRNSLFHLLNQHSGAVVISTVPSVEDQVAEAFSLPFLFVNKAYEELMQLPLSEIEEKKGTKDDNLLRTFLTCEKSERSQVEAFAATLKGGNTAKFLIPTEKTNDGIIFYNFVCAIPVNNLDGKLTYIISSHYDVTSRTSSNDEIKRNEEFLYLLSMVLRGY